MNWLTETIYFEYGQILSVSDSKVVQEHYVKGYIDVSHRLEGY